MYVSEVGGNIREHKVCDIVMLTFHFKTNGTTFFFFRIVGKTYTSIVHLYIQNDRRTFSDDSVNKYDGHMCSIALVPELYKCDTIGLALSHSQIDFRGMCVSVYIRTLIPSFVFCADFLKCFLVW